MARRSLNRQIEMDKINLTNEQVNTMIENYMRANKINYSEFARMLNVHPSAINNARYLNSRSYILWVWADTHREYLNYPDNEEKDELDINEDMINAKKKMLANQFKLWRLAHGFSQTDVSRSSSYSRPMIAAIENSGIKHIGEMITTMMKVYSSHEIDEEYELNLEKMLRLIGKVPKDKQVLFLQLCTSIANTLHNDKEEGED